jgi:hypothetical protein
MVLTKLLNTCAPTRGSGMLRLPYSRVNLDVSGSSLPRSDRYSVLSGVRGGAIICKYYQGRDGRG